jgi:ATP-dependent RNA helicase DHX37/DHR1
MISKIHKKLPQGGILVFLTGKQEIVRMVKRLRRALNPKNQESRAEAPASTFLEANDVTLSGFSNAVENSTIPRDMDDDEADGDIFRADLSDEYDDSEEFDLNLGSAETKASDSKDAGFEKALVLPLYSLLPAEEQAKIFATVPEGYRLIVVATNVAETSITIPGISYVVDTGRQKCRNYNTSTGVTSFDIMWISKAAADQRAGRAGRTGPGHCYRLYSSSMYARQMDAYALPEVLTRPLEDVVLAMKGMNVSNVGDFPFPTPPDRKQLDAAVRLLADIGCVDLSEIEEKGGDGQATRLGVAVANLPLGVRFGKMLLVAAQAGVLDYAIAMIAALTESSPFVHNGQLSSNGSDEDSDIEINIKDKEDVGAKKRQLWAHKGGDVLAMMLATGAYAFAGHDAGGVSERVACRKFCETNGLHPVIMERIQKMRLHLARLVKTRLPNAQSIATRTGGFLSSMKPPNKLQEDHLKQAIASGLLDNVAMLAPFGYFPGEHTFNLRSAYISCSLNAREPLFMDRNSVLYSRDFRTLPQWVCFESLQRKTLKDGTSVAVMKNLTPVDPIWLGPLAKGSQMIRYGEPLLSPLPTYDVDKDAILCSVLTKYGSHGWEIPPAKMEMFDVLNAPGRKASATFAKEDSFRWFARFLLEGKVFSELKNLPAMLNDSPAVITRRTPLAKVSALVSALAGAGVDSAEALSKHWAEEDDKFLFKILKSWVKAPNTAAAKELWIVTVKTHVMNWKSTHEKRLVVQ